MDFFSRKIRHPLSRKPRTATPRLEPLEGRQLLSGFGPEDGAYIVEPWSGTYNDMVIQPSDQKILAAGSKYSADPNAPYDHRMAIARYTSSGNVDTAYGTGGLTAPAFLSSIEYGNALALQSDGKAVVAGLANSQHAVARFKANGSLDTAFGSGGLAMVDVVSTDFYSPANAVGLQSTGKAVIAGVILDITTSSDPAVLARFTTGGALDSGKNGFGTVVSGKARGYTLSSFGGNTNSFNDLMVQPDDKIVIVGHSVNDANGGLLVARYTASGVLDTTFGGSGSTVLLPSGLTSARGFGVTRQSDGKIVIVGACTGIDGAADLLVARFNTNGTLDTAFGGGSGYVRLDVDGNASQTSEVGNELTIQPDGKIVVAGSYSLGTSPSKVLVARLNSNGTADSTFGSGGFKIGSLAPELEPPQGIGASSVALAADGGIIVAGSGNWSPAGGAYELKYSHPLLMRFLPTTASSAATSSATAATTSEQAQSSLTNTLSLWTTEGSDLSSLESLKGCITSLPDATSGQDSGGIPLTFNTADGAWSMFHSSRRGRSLRPAAWVELRS